MDKYPVPALAFFDESFLPLTTSSSQLLRVNKYNHLYVTQVHGTPVGQSTNPSIGYLPYNDTGYTALDSIALTATQTLIISGLHSTGTAQAKVEVAIVPNDASPTTIILLGLITESTPNWDPYIGHPLEVAPGINCQIILRIKGLRQSRSGDGSGRLFARIV
jgi:hypothetical protein